MRHKIKEVILGSAFLQITTLTINLNIEPTGLLIINYKLLLFFLTHCKNVLNVCLEVRKDSQVQFTIKMSRTGRLSLETDFHGGSKDRGTTKTPNLRSKFTRNENSGCSRVPPLSGRNYSTDIKTSNF